MGVFSYGEETRIRFDDRVLLHLQLVIGTKLRRGESFMFTWGSERLEGGGRTSVWLNPHIALRFEYSDHRVNPVNPAWIDALAKTANSPTGLVPLPESETTHSGR